MKIFTIALLACGISPAAWAVSRTTGTVNGITADIWRWNDAAGNTRTVALKQEGHGNSGHGGYAVQFTYVAGGATITIDAETGSDGGFGYFVSHERYRHFKDGAVDTIARHIFGVDDSPLGRGFAATATIPLDHAAEGAERFVIQYGHYGTITSDPVAPNTGGDSVPLLQGKANYAFYSLPASTTWVFQDGHDYPRIDVAVDLAGVVPPGGTAPTADLVSFDMRGPYGVMVFDNDADGTVKTVLWGDQQYQFAPAQTPVARDSTWKWTALNKGARYQALLVGGFEMGLFEPANVGASGTVDSYAAERGYTAKSYRAAGGISYSSCNGNPAQILPSDGTWPYQSVEYSLSCTTGSFKQPTTGKKIAWGTTSYYGTSLTAVYNGQKSFPFNGFPATSSLAYSACLVLGAPAHATSLTQTAATLFKSRTPNSSCAKEAVP